MSRPVMAHHVEGEDVGGPKADHTAGRLLIVVMIVGAAFVTTKQFLQPQSALAAWIQDWSAGIDRSQKTGKPLLVLFTADWCGPCRKLKSEVLSDAEVTRGLTDFTLLKIDLTDRTGPNNRIASAYGVRAIPTMIMFDSGGRQIDRISGSMHKDALLQWVEKAR